MPKVIKRKNTDPPRWGVTLHITDAHPQPIFFHRWDTANLFARLLAEMFEPYEGREIRIVDLNSDDKEGVLAALRWED